MSALIDTSGDDHQVAQWIWRNLVPKSGRSKVYLAALTPPSIEYKAGLLTPYSLA
jgi:hypothetical protein